MVSCVCQIYKASIIFEGILLCNHKINSILHQSEHFFGKSENKFKIISSRMMSGSNERSSKETASLRIKPGDIQMAEQ